jgi:hypothetical protein
MAQAVGQRAAAAGQAPAYGMAGMNTASKAVADAYGKAGSTIADPNFNINKATTLTDALKTATGAGGGISDFAKYLFGSSGGGTTGTINYSPHGDTSLDFGYNDPNS